MAHKIEIEFYEHSAGILPATGRHILAQQSEDEIIVYQAFRPAIAEYAVKHQRFGGPDYSFERMSWIKPNFLWMMYRCGWAEKPGQERVLAIWLKKTAFESILTEAAWSSYQRDVYENEQAWKAALNAKDVRLQWDPDHDPYGKPMTRKAIQLGLKGNMLKTFSNEFVTGIEDITGFVTTQRRQLKTGGLNALQVPVERVLNISNAAASHNIHLSTLT